MSTGVHARPGVSLPPLPNGVEADHDIMRDLIDHPHATRAPRGSQPTGLFQIPTLREPEAFLVLAQRTLIRCQLLVSRLAHAAAPDTPSSELVRVVQNLDRLSDLLCGVIDMAELVRHAHPEPAWAEAANAAYEYLCNYMNVLNTHTGLYDALRRTMAEPAVWNVLSEEARAVALIFLRDFEKSGIHLPPRERERFVELSDEILVLGRAFLQDISTGNDSVAEFPLDLLDSASKSTISRLRAWTRQRTVPVMPGSWELHYISRHASDERARRLAYHINYTGQRQPVAILEQLLHARHKLAVLTGKRSFADMTLVDKMAGTPENVQAFLNIVAESQRPAAQSVLDHLARLKANDSPEPLHAWDREYYAERYLAAHQTKSLAPLSPYLSLGSVFAGLSRLFFLLYGIHFRAAPVQPGEVWHDDVLKLEVVDEDEGGVIGTIYCDLFSRIGKPPSAAHYTVRCSRRLDEDDAAGDVALASPELPRDVDMGHVLGVRGVAARGRAGRFQLPVVVLMTDFQLPSASHTGPTLLRWHEVETLFHEMGHAIHCTC